MSEIGVSKWLGRDLFYWPAFLAETSRVSQYVFLSNRDRTAKVSSPHCQTFEKVVLLFCYFYISLLDA